ncbi:DUF3667 domain-containing protein [Arenimonas sp.]|uniref:DUF3667 domain-containing protein n=1 Tax=Arenimonas sp. TaxID=1872635 RepID=UPI0039E34DB3
MSQFAEAATDLDGRFWRSLRALMLQPGRIAADYMLGRRAHWMSPLSLFLFANVLFFFAPGLTDLTLGLEQQVPERVLREFRTIDQQQSNRTYGEQMHNVVTAPLARQAIRRAQARSEAAGRPFDLEKFATRYHAQSDSIGKLLVIVHVPGIALVLMLATWRKRRYYAEHFVLALSLVAFTLLFVQLVVHPSAWLYQWAMAAVGSPRGMPAYVAWLLVAINVAYFSAACRRCYGGGWILALVRGFCAFAALGVSSLFFYRGLQLLITLWTM